MAARSGNSCHTSRVVAGCCEWQVLLFELRRFAVPFGVGSKVLRSNVITAFTVVQMLTPICNEQWNAAWAGQLLSGTSAVLPALQLVIQRNL